MVGALVIVGSGLEAMEVVVKIVAFASWYVLWITDKCCNRLKGKGRYET